MALDPHQDRLVSAISRAREPKYVADLVGALASRVTYGLRVSEVSP